MSQVIASCCFCSLLVLQVDSCQGTSVLRTVQRSCGANLRAVMTDQWLPCLKAAYMRACAGVTGALGLTCCRALSRLAWLTHAASMSASKALNAASLTRALMSAPVNLHPATSACLTF